MYLKYGISKLTTKRPDISVMHMFVKQIPYTKSKVRGHTKKIQIIYYESNRHVLTQVIFSSCIYSMQKVKYKINKFWIGSYLCFVIFFL
jgi:hypothetical protein